MPKRFLGNIMTDAPTAPAGPYQDSAASGVWSLAEALSYTKGGLWPIAGNTPPPTYVGGVIASAPNTSTDQTVSLTSLTGGLASSPSENDIVIIYYGVATNGSNENLAFVTSGYTEVADLFQNDSYAGNLLVGYKVMGATPDTSVTCNTPTSTSSWGPVMAVQVWRNVDTTTPMDVTPTTNGQANTLLIDPPAITPVTSSAVIISGGCGGHNHQSADTYSSSDLSNFLTLSGTQTYKPCVGMGSYSEWTSGSFDPAAFTFSDSTSSSYSCVSCTLALRPA